MAGAGYKLFNTGDVLTAQQVNEYLQQQAVMVFADASARTTALSGVLAEGMISYLKDTNAIEKYTGSAWESIATTIPASYGYAAGKNAIINGDFRIWQRGTSSTSNDIYLADRWRWYQNGNGSATYSRQSFTAGTAPASNYESQYFARIAYTSLGTTTGAEFRQPVEDVRTFAGRTVTLSFWAKADTTRTVTLSLRQNFGSGGSSTVTTSLSSQSVTSSWVRYSASVALPSLSGKTIGTSSYLDVVFGFTPTATSTFDFWGVQLESSSAATDFQTATGTYQGELAACMRYYQNTGNIAVSAYSATGVLGYIYPVPPRGTPSVSFSYSGTNNAIYNIDSGVTSTLSSPTIIGSATALTNMYAFTPSNWAVGKGTGFFTSWVIDAEL